MNPKNYNKGKNRDKKIKVINNKKESDVKLCVKQKDKIKYIYDLLNINQSNILNNTDNSKANKEDNDKEIQSKDNSNRILNQQLQFTQKSIDNVNLYKIK